MECVACEYACEDGADQVQHYQSDWHRYNLRRRVREMPSISFDAFEKRLAAAQELLAEKRAENAPDVHSYTCVICRKNFGSQNACDQHLNSKKHKAAAKKYKGTGPVIKSFTKELETNEENPDAGSDHPELPEAAGASAVGGGSKAEQSGLDGEPLSGEEGEEDDELDELQFAGRKPIPINVCLFCNHESEDMDSSLEHMRTEHSFILPEEQYVSDKEGYVTYLGEKVGLGCLCLYCAGDKNGFKSLQATQSHMKDKQHCRILYNDDFDRVEFEDFYDYSKVYKDGVRVPLGERLATDHTGEAILFDGTRIGHRLFKQVYKQRFISDDQREAVQLNRKAIADRFWSKALGMPGALAPKGFHNTAKSLIMYKKSKVLAVQAHAQFVRQQKNHQKGVDRFANKLTGQVRGGMYASYTMAR